VPDWDMRFQNTLAPTQKQQEQKRRKNRWKMATASAQYVYAT